MDAEDIRRLVALNNGFYRENFASFSRTRQGIWPGWTRVAGWVPATGALGVLDIACGNLRFERFMRDAFPGRALSFTCLDSCGALVGDCPEVEFAEVDVIERLRAGGVLVQPERRFDLVVSFGFLHHVPSFELRRALLEEMARLTAPGGLMACSLWRFADDAALAARARRSTEGFLARQDLNLEEGDYLLGWDGAPDVCRYCHSFSDDEVEALIAAAGAEAKLVDRFASDGRTGALNEYLLLTTRPAG